MRRLAILLVASILMLTNSYAQSIDDIITRGKVVVAVDPTSAPFGVAGPDGQPDGYDVDVAKLVAKYMGVDLELVAVTSANRIPYLLTDRVDLVISLFSITPERALQVWFSDPYATVGTVITARTEQIASFDDLKGLRSASRAATFDLDPDAKADCRTSKSCASTTRRHRSGRW